MIEVHSHNAACCPECCPSTNTVIAEMWFRSGLSWEITKNLDFTNLILVLVQYHITAVPAGRATKVLGFTDAMMRILACLGVPANCEILLV